MLDSSTPIGAWQAFHLARGGGPRANSLEPARPVPRSGAAVGLAATVLPLFTNGGGRCTQRLSKASGDLTIWMDDASGGGVFSGGVPLDEASVGLHAIRNAKGGPGKARAVGQDNEGNLRAKG